MGVYLAVGIFAIVSLAFILLTLLLSRLLRSKEHTENEDATYECGEEPIGSARVQMNFHYYLFSLAYVLFAVEIAFILPWAVAFRNMNRLVVFIEMFAFIAILFTGLGYAWAKGALEWI